jgi:ribosome-binding protein aMBF1 (putative translation factor)
MDCQDWTPVTVRKTTKAQGQASAQVQQSQRQTSDSVQARKLAENDIVKLKQLSRESRQELVTRRAILKMTQVQLNQACLFPINTINKIESGQLTPSVSQLNTLNRILKTGLKYEK